MTQSYFQQRSQTSATSSVQDGRESPPSVTKTRETVRILTCQVWPSLAPSPIVSINTTSISTVRVESHKHQYEIHPTRPRHVWCKKPSLSVWGFGWLSRDPTCTLRRFFWTHVASRWWTLNLKGACGPLTGDTPKICEKRQIGSRNLWENANKFGIRY